MTARDDEPPAGPDPEPDEPVGDEPGDRVDPGERADEGGDAAIDLRFRPRGDDGRWGQVPSPSGHELLPEDWSLDQELARPAAQQPGHPFAGVGRRVLARVVSVLIWSMVLAVLLALTDLVWDLGDRPPRVVFYTFWLLPLVVDIALVARLGWDPGKFVVGIRVVDRSGGPPGYGPAVVRTAVVEAPRLLSVMPAFLGDLGSWLWVPWSALIVWTMSTGPHRQGWQDRAAGTYVIDRRGVAAFHELMQPDDERAGGDEPEGAA